MTLETLSLIPLVLSINGLFDEWECDHLIDIAAPHVAPSVVNKMDNDVGASLCVVFARGERGVCGAVVCASSSCAVRATATATATTAAVTAAAAVVGMLLLLSLLLCAWSGETSGWVYCPFSVCSVRCFPPVCGCACHSALLARLVAKTSDTTPRL